MTTLNEIQKRLAAAIQQSGKTQKEIAEAIKIKQPTISHYIKGDKMPSLDTFANLCAFLDIDANEILGIKETYR